MRDRPHIITKDGNYLFPDGIKVTPENLQRAETHQKLVEGKPLSDLTELEFRYLIESLPPQRNRVIALQPPLNPED